jgi:arylsulfatase A-like enzyme
MKRRLDRREFLKLAGLLSLSYAAPRSGLARGAPQLAPGDQNVLVIVFDALSAYNISLYGYARETMPNLAKLAERAVVYHNHFAGGPFTTPGTASLLTGALPWSHRAILHNGTVDESFVDKSIFHAFPNHYRIAYSHNPLVNTLLAQFLPDLDEFVPQNRLFLANDGFIQRLFDADQDIATVSWARTIKSKEEGYAYSLFLSHLYEHYRDSKIARFKPLFPRGLPNISGDNYFLLEQAIDWTAGQVNAIHQPFLGYFHFLPPHFPYKTHKDFYGRFEKDGWEPVEKPVDAFTQEKSPDNLLKWRTWYDEFILYLDREFGRLFNDLEQSGLLENTWVIFTSDHGEMFERGISGHLTVVLNQPLVRIPLLIFEPGRKTRADVYTPTSAIDLLPTLLNVTGQNIPEWVEGVVLPPYAQTSPEPERKLYVVQAKQNDPRAPLRRATTSLVQGRYKLVYFFGYDELGGDGERIELYDVEADPEELEDLFPAQRETGAALLDELKNKLAEVNEPYL